MSNIGTGPIGVVDISDPSAAAQFVSDALAKLPPCHYESSEADQYAAQTAVITGGPVPALRVDPTDRTATLTAVAPDELLLASSYHTYYIKATGEQTGLHCFFKGIDTGGMKKMASFSIQLPDNRGDCRPMNGVSYVVNCRGYRRESMFDILRDASLRHGPESNLLLAPMSGPWAISDTRWVQANIRWIHRRELQGVLTTRLAALQGRGLTVTAPSHLMVDRGARVPCSYCDAAHTPEFKRCNRCKGVWYCSKTCQKSHWFSGHKSACEPYVN
jgi:hypothetical protein